MNSQKVNSAASHNRKVGCSTRPSLNERIYVPTSERMKMRELKRMIAAAHERFFAVRNISLHSIQ